jgi:hypothetical protein
MGQLDGLKQVWDWLAITPSRPLRRYPSSTNSHHQIDRSLIERLREAARRTVAESRPQIEAMLAA